jgi:amino acid transporter
LEVGSSTRVDWSPVTCGPSQFPKLVIAGLAACLSGTCYAELSARVPLAGSACAYTFVARSELPAILAAACLSLEYKMAAGAVARS